jgi:T-complex protein 1 subunit delta
LDNREQLIKSASTSLNSKVVFQQSSILAPLAVDAVLKVVEPGGFETSRDELKLIVVIFVGREQVVSLSDIKVIKQIGGTVEDAELIEGLVFPHKAANVSGPKRIEKAKIGFIQFCISPPKTDMDHNVVVSDYAAMDRVLKEERTYILNIVKQIKKAGCNVLLVISVG